MKGVKILTTDSTNKSSVTKDEPNATTLSAMKEVESGQDAGTVRLDSLQSFMASMEE